MRVVVGGRDPTVGVSQSKLLGRPGQWECLHIVTGSGCGAFRLPQNLGSGQKEGSDRNILRMGRRRRNRRNDQR